MTGKVVAFHWSKKTELNYYMLNYNYMLLVRVDLVKATFLTSRLTNDADV